MTNPTLLTPDERERGVALHTRDAKGEVLTDAERDLVQHFRAAIEAEEAEQLRDGKARHEQHIRWLRSRNEEMEQLLIRQTELANRLRRLLAEAELERQTLEQERERITQMPEPVF